MKAPVATRRAGRYAAVPLAEINIIPLVDVVLVILIIFMVTTTFDRRPKLETPPPVPPAPELPLNLPQSGAAMPAPAAPEPPLVLGVDKAGRKYIGDTPATTEALHQFLRDTATKDKDRHIRIDADQDARYADVVEVVELCQFEGLRNVGLRCSTKNP